jgi:hypothetical protein
VFNQQILTGYSLQPFHYEQFITNYLVLTGVVIACFTIIGPPKRLVLWIAIALGVGFATALKSFSVTIENNRRQDKAVPVYQTIEERSCEHELKGLTLFEQPILAIAAPTNHNIPTLWSPYSYTFGTTSEAEDQERFFQFLYYSGIDSHEFESNLKSVQLYQATLFGLPRVNTRLATRFVPITDQEIRAKAEEYTTYISNFSQQQALRWPLSFLIIDDEQGHDFSHLDRWYERDGGSHIGGSIIYELRSRNSTQSESNASGDGK